MPVSSTEDLVRFGQFELDLKAGQLSRNGAKIRLPQQSLQLLAALVERPGEIVTREELTRRLWSTDVFVDFDHGLNKSIQKLREALGDSAESPTYIETIQRVGYRFIAPVSSIAAVGGARAAVGRQSEKKVQEPLGEFPATGPEGVAGAQVRSMGKLGRWILLAGCVAVTAASAGWFVQHRRMHAVEPIRSIAVLPLDNLSGDPGQDYFADGMTDELTTMLAKNSALRVVSRTSVMQYKGARRPLPEIARALGVDGVLEGSVERVGDNVHMTVQLIRAESDSHVWAESYDRDANDVVSLPGDVATAIAKRLKSTVAQPAALRYVSPEAHDAYLRGRYLWYIDDNPAAGKYFRKAVELQPDYALGWYGLSMYYAQGAGEEINPEEALPRQLAAAKRVIELDDTLAEGHEALGTALYYQRDFPQAEKEIDRAIEINPGWFHPYYMRAHLDLALNRNEEAIRDEKKSMELDPFGQPWAMGMIYYLARHYDDAIHDIRTRLDGTPTDPNLHQMLSDTYRRKGDLKQSVQESEKVLTLGNDPKRAALIRRTYEKGGYEALMNLDIDDLKKKEKTEYVSPLYFALDYAQLGDREKTLSFLEAAYRQRDKNLILLQKEPAYDFLHGDERYRSIVNGMGLPPEW